MEFKDRFALENKKQQLEKENPNNEYRIINNEIVMRKKSAALRVHDYFMREAVSLQSNDRRDNVFKGYAYYLRKIRPLVKDDYAKHIILNDLAGDEKLFFEGCSKFEYAMLTSMIMREKNAEANLETETYENKVKGLASEYDGFIDEYKGYTNGKRKSADAYKIAEPIAKEKSKADSINKSHKF